MGFSLKEMNSFGVDSEAENVIRIDSQSKLQIWRESEPDQEVLILGEGNNVLFVHEPKQTILKNELKGKHIVHETEESILLEIASGENWHALVEWAVNNGYGGIENLALIPGSVGAAPVQNIGAYGVEVKDRIEQVKYFDLEKCRFEVLSADQCLFSYRDSIFKNELAGKAFITGIQLRLSKNSHDINTKYGALQQNIEGQGIESPGIKDVFNAVVAIRNQKLPDPAVLGNAGSYFKNPVISTGMFEQLKHKFPDIPSYPAGDQFVKLAAAWLIDRSGWKGKRIGDVGTHENQALVIVNYGGASGMDIYQFGNRIKASVFANFGVQLEEEVNLVK